MSTRAWVGKCGNSTCIEVTADGDGFLIKSASTLPGEEVRATREEWAAFEARMQAPFRAANTMFERELLSLRADLQRLADLMDEERFEHGPKRPGDRIRQVLAGTWKP